MCTLLEEQNSRDDEDDDYELEKSPNKRSTAKDAIHIKVTPPKHLNDEAHSDNDDNCFIMYRSHGSKKVMEINEYDEEVVNIAKSSNRADTYTPTFSTSSSSGYDGNSYSQTNGLFIQSCGTPISTESVPCSIPSSLSMPSSSGDEEDAYEKGGFVNGDKSKSGWLTVGENIRFESKPGIIAYVGETEFAPGLWVGIALNSADGKNDGSINGIQYFECKPKHGLFVKADKLMPGSKLLK